ncbi:hypothetical protein GCM10023185_27750 [Hymenobacter saemangeumensis]|uniref:Thioredoxin domain-containing protein n=1 Tax=Hymenobacter saemangeumensis TaxID=1084522 RepID=A0ABP8IK20_9BACT
MTEEERKYVHDTDDEGLRRFTHEHIKVFAKFTSDNCAICKALAPPFEKFADDEPYRSILFVRLDSDENPVARQLMNERAAPFFVSYCQGRLMECDTLQSEEDVKAQLDRLLAVMPITG